MKKALYAAFAAIVLFSAAAIVPIQASNNDLSYDGFNGQFQSVDADGIAFDTMFGGGSCCNCACGFTGCNLIFQGRDCSTEGTRDGSCSTDSC